MGTRLDAALAYLAQGYSIIPCRPNNKRPLIRWEYFQKNRATAGQIQAWWMQWPDANLAVITGVISAITVIDIDGGPGTLSFAKMQKQPSQLTRLIKTPHGWHLYYRYNPAFHTGAGFLPGLDVRNDGGYVIAPPSTVGGIAYAVLRDIDPSLLDVVPEAFLSTTRKAEPDAQGRPLPWSEQVAQHSRNDTLYREAHKLREAGIPEDQALELLLVRVQKRYEPNDFPMEEIKRTIHSAYQKPTVRAIWEEGESEVHLIP